MDVKQNLAEIAALIGEPTRIMMLWSLIGGQARPASELAFYANVSAQNASALYILGDLFEYWAGDDDLEEPFNAAICAALKQLGESGIPIHFIPGNRDFLAGPAFAKAAGLTILADGVVHNIAGTATLLMHGDTLCTDDTAYQRFRSEVRSPAWQQRFLAQPLSERKAQIEALRRRSETEKQLKPMTVMDTNAKAVAAAFRESGCRRLIHGHTHRLAHHVTEVDGQRCDRWVLGDWYDSGNYLRCDADGCHFIPLPSQ